MNEKIIVALISGGFVFVNSLISNFGKLNKMEKAINKIAEGLAIGLDNDRVIFKALREHKINGESEAQEIKMDKYLNESTKRGFRID